MSTFWTALLTGVAGLIISAIGTYFGTRYRIRKELEQQYDVSLRDLRLAAYAELWKAMKPLAQFGRDRYPTRDELEELTRTLSTWYFETGGIYLSTPTRDAYFRLQRALTLLSREWSAGDRRELDPDSFERLRTIGSRLRTRMTLDVGTRRPFSLEQPSDLPDEKVDPATDPDEGWLIQRWEPDRTARPATRDRGGSVGARG